MVWYGVTVTMEEPRGLIRKKYLSCFNMCEVVMHTVEPVSTIEST